MQLMIQIQILKRMLSLAIKRMSSLAMKNHFEDMSDANIENDELLDEFDEEILLRIEEEARSIKPSSVIDKYLKNIQDRIKEDNRKKCTKTFETTKIISKWYLLGSKKRLGIFFWGEEFTVYEAFII